MVISPLLSMYGLLDKLSTTFKASKKDVKISEEAKVGREISEEELEITIKITNHRATSSISTCGICSILIFFVPVLYFVLANFEYGDSRPLWSHQLGDVRMGGFIAAPDRT